MRIGEPPNDHAIFLEASRAHPFAATVATTTGSMESQEVGVRNSKEISPNVDERTRLLAYAPMHARILIDYVPG